MSEQPTALRLADALISPHAGPWDNLEAAAELRRLHSVNAQLLEALEYHQEQTRPIQKTIDAIAASKGKYD
jgi:hypothetical protein